MSQRYMYTSSLCGNCKALKKEYASKGINYIERDADRIKNPEDDIDKEAFVELSLNNMVLPIVVEK